MGKVADEVTALVSPIASALGLEILEVIYEKKYDGMNLTVVIDKDGGVTIDDCEKLHRAIDGPLDELDPIENQYILNVSSPGLDRPLKTDKDFKRNLGKKIKVKLYKSADGVKSFEGKLLTYDAEKFVLIDSKEKEHSFLRKDAAHIEPVIEF